MAADAGLGQAWDAEGGDRAAHRGRERGLGALQRAAENRTTQAWKGATSGGLELFWIDLLSSSAPRGVSRDIPHRPAQPLLPRKPAQTAPSTQFFITSLSPLLF